jgi:hypothetical protein
VFGSSSSAKHQREVALAKTSNATATIRRIPAKTTPTMTPVTETKKMTINVQRKHDNGQLKGSLIGVIVGVVLAGILLIVAVALLVFAKATSRWCFADDDEPNTKPSRGPGPRSRTAGNQQAQVYRFIPLFWFHNN